MHSLSRLLHEQERHSFEPIVQMRVLAPAWRPDLTRGEVKRFIVCLERLSFCFFVIAGSFCISVYS